MMTPRQIGTLIGIAAGLALLFATPLFVRPAHAQADEIPIQHVLCVDQAAMQLVACAHRAPIIGSSVLGNITSVTTGGSGRRCGPEMTLVMTERREFKCAPTANLTEPQ